jgi:hypothetical protein
MQNTTNRWMSSIVLLAFFAIIAYAGRSSAQASSVVVANTTSQPVPTTVQGTPNVRSLQGGTWSVYLLGSPTLRVNNAPSAPVPVSDTRDKQPFQQAYFGQINDGAFVAQAGAVTVPAGKRLVIDRLNVYSTQGSGNTVNVVGVTVYSPATGSEKASLIFAAQTPRDNTLASVCDATTQVCGEAGETIYFRVVRPNSETVGACSYGFNVMGHYVPLP